MTKKTNKNQPSHDFDYNEIDVRGIKPELEDGLAICTRMEKLYKQIQDTTDGYRDKANTLHKEGLRNECKDFLTETTFELILAHKEYAGAVRELRHILHLIRKKVNL